MGIEYSGRALDQLRKARKRRRQAGARVKGALTITRVDGTVEHRRSYSQRELTAIVRRGEAVRGKQEPERRRR